MRVYTTWNKVISNMLPIIFLLCLFLASAGISNFVLSNTGSGFSREKIINSINNDIPGNLNKIGSQIPSEFKLFQNYPNPFNPSTKIRFNIIESETSSQHVTLIIYNIIRQKVETLLSGHLKAGYYEIVWDASDYNSGVYFYQLRTEKDSEVMRMILVK